MKRNIKTVTAFILTLVLIASFPAAAFAETIVGESTVDNVTVNVVLPTNLNFAMDPLGLDTTGDNQIATQDFFFVNQTFAPVKITLEITAETSGGAVLVSSTGGLSLDDTDVTDKELYFGALGATGLTGAAIDGTTVGVSYSAIFGSTTGPAASYTTVSAVAETLAMVTPGSDGTTGSAVISFALDKAIENATTPGAIDSLAAANAGVAAFQFYSQLNTYADWEANDITVSGNYTLIPLRDTTYTGYEYIDGSLNQLVPPVVVPPAPTTFSITVDDDGNGTASADVSTASAGDTVTLTATPSGAYLFDAWVVSPASVTITGDTFTMPAEDVTVTATFELPYGGISGFISGQSTGTTIAAITSSKADATNITIPFYFGSKTITSLTMNPPATPYALPGAEYAISGNNLVIKKDVGTYTLRTVGTTGNKTMVLTLSDASTFTFTINVTN